jgi:hypothetical protein
METTFPNVLALDHRSISGALTMARRLAAQNFESCSLPLGGSASTLERCGANHTLVGMALADIEKVTLTTQQS